MPEEPEPQSVAPLKPPLAESKNLRDLLDDEGRIKGSPANDEPDADDGPDE